MTETLRLTCWLCGDAYESPAGRRRHDPRCPACRLPEPSVSAEVAELGPALGPIVRSAMDHPDVDDRHLAAAVRAVVSSHGAHDRAAALATVCSTALAMHRRLIT